MDAKEAIRLKPKPNLLAAVRYKPSDGRETQTLRHRAVELHDDEKFKDNGKTKSNV